MLNNGRGRTHHWQNESYEKFYDDNDVRIQIAMT